MNSYLGTMASDDRTDKLGIIAHPLISQKSIDY